MGGRHDKGPGMLQFRANSRRDTMQWKAAHVISFTHMYVPLKTDAAQRQCTRVRGTPCGSGAFVWARILAERIVYLPAYSWLDDAVLLTATRIPFPSGPLQARLNTSQLPLQTVYYSIVSNGLKCRQTHLAIKSVRERTSLLD